MTVTLQPLPRCHYGDVEAVVSDLKYSRTKRVLVSLEPVRPEEPAAPTAVREISEEDLYNGTTLRLTFPQVRRRAVMGVFLCKDSAGSGRCGDKEAVGARDVQRELSEAFRNPDFQARDKIYYFNPVYVARDALAIASDAERPEPSAWRERMYYVASTARTEDTPKVSEAVLKASGLIQILTNFPLKYENESLVVVLPYFGSKCTR